MDKKSVLKMTDSKPYWIFRLKICQPKNKKLIGKILHYSGYKYMILLAYIKWTGRQLSENVPALANTSLKQKQLWKMNYSDNIIQSQNCNIIMKKKNRNVPKNNLTNKSEVSIWPICKYEYILVYAIHGWLS